MKDKTMIDFNTIVRWWMRKGDKHDKFVKIRKLVRQNRVPHYFLEAVLYCDGEVQQ